MGKRDGSSAKSFTVVDSASSMQTWDTSTSEPAQRKGCPFKMTLCLRPLCQTLSNALDISKKKAFFHSIGSFPRSKQDWNIIFRGLQNINQPDTNYIMFAGFIWMEISNNFSNTIS